jgi:hypothetical protein
MTNYRRNLLAGNSFTVNLRSKPMGFARAQPILQTKRFAAFDGL